MKSFSLFVLLIGYDKKAWVTTLPNKSKGLYFFAGFVVLFFLLILD